MNDASPVKKAVARRTCRSRRSEYRASSGGALSGSMASGCGAARDSRKAHAAISRFTPATNFMVPGSPIAGMSRNAAARTPNTAPRLLRK
jgi:hypothetical protein